jgi:non-specific serine/threonine protein kinase
MGLQPESDQPSLSLLTSAIDAGRVLILFDNCEHLVDACARLVDALLRSCPNLHVLATSREALAVPSESVFGVLPLAVPDPDDLIDPERLSQVESFRLFLDRARSVKPGFEIDETTASAVAHICHRLEGIPLALELAAARIKILGPKQIATRLHDRFSLLTAGSRTALPRQQTLKALIDWSFDLLTGGERALFRRLAVFAGGWTIEAAEEVLPSGPIARSAVLDLLGSLVDKSLVIVDEQPTGHPRYRMLETLREYAGERLREAGELELLATAHRDYYLQLAESLDPDLRAAGQISALDRLEREHDNLRAVLHRFGSTPSPEAVRLLAALWHFWYFRNYLAEGNSWLDRAGLVELTDAGLPSVRALAGNGFFTAILGDPNRGQMLLARAEAQARESGSEVAVAWALWHRGMAGMVLGESENAAVSAEELEEVGRTAGFEWAFTSGQALSGASAVMRGDFERAGAKLLSAAERARRVGDRMLISISVSALANVYAARGAYEKATASFAEGVQVLRELGHRGGISFALWSWGKAALTQGDVAGAAARFCEGLELASQLGKRPDIAAHLGCLAAVAARIARPKEAVLLVAAATSLREASGATAAAPQRQFEEWALAEAEAVLGPRQREVMWLRGREMPLAAVIDLALKLRDGATAAVANPA